MDVIGQAFVAIRPDVSKFLTESEAELNGPMQKLSRLGGVAAAGLGSAAVAFGGLAITAAIEGEKAQARFDNAVSKAGPAFANLGKLMGEAEDKFARLGFENDELAVSLAKLVPVTKNSRDAMDKLALAADVARARHISLEEATAILVKVQTGHVALLGRLGIATKDANGQTISQEEAIKRLTGLYGGQAQRSANTFGGQIEALKAQFHNFAEEVGQKVIPILQSIIGWMTQHKEVVLVLAGVIGGALVAAFTAWAISAAAAAAATLAAAAPVLAIIAAITAVVAAAYFLWTNWNQVWTWIKDHPAIAIVIAILAAPVAAFVAIVGGLHWLYDNWDSVWNAIQSVTGVVWSVISPIFNGIVGAMNIIIAVVQTYISVWQSAWGAVSGAVSAAWGAIDPILSALISAIQTVIGFVQDLLGALDDVKSAGSGLADLGSGGLFSGFGDLFGGLGFASGGFVPGSGNRDSVPAMLTPGEYVMTRDEVAAARSGGSGPTFQFNIQGDILSPTRWIRDAMTTAHEEAIVGSWS